MQFKRKKVELLPAATPLEKVPPSPHLELLWCGIAGGPRDPCLECDAGNQKAYEGG